MNNDVIQKKKKKKSNWGKPEKGCHHIWGSEIASELYIFIIIGNYRCAVGGSDQINITDAAIRRWLTGEPRRICTKLWRKSFPLISIFTALNSAAVETPWRKATDLTVMLNRVETGESIHTWFESSVWKQQIWFVAEVLLLLQKLKEKWGFWIFLGQNMLYPMSNLRNFWHPP